MAKKRRKEEVEEEKYEFVPPDFDEKSFLKKDMLGTKTLMITTAMAIVIGIAAYFLGVFNAILGGAIIIFGAAILRWIYPFFKINVRDVDKKTIAGNILVLMVLSLGIWIMLMNSPFSDHSPPQITSESTFFNNGTVWKKYVSDTATPIQSGNLVNITVQCRDNGKIASVTIEVHMASQSTGTFTDMTNTGTYGKYEYVRSYTTDPSNPNQPTTYIWTIKVVDGVGNEAVKSGSFIVNPLNP
jgi:hypothetical protein